MNRLHVVIVEDQQSDAELIVVELRRAGFDPVWRRVTTEEEYLALLEGDSDGQAPDVVLADYNLPQFTGLRALELMRARGLDIPFILISGTVGEDVAVEVMKRGASDYLLKDRLARLGAAVQHALAQRTLRASKQEAEQTIREAERRFRALYETGQALAALGSPAEILERVFAKIGDVLDNRNAYVAIYDEPNQYVSFPIYAIEGERQPSTGRRFAHGRTEYVLRRRVPLCINRNVTAEMAARGIDLVGRKAASLLVVPMLAGDKVVGVIGLQDYIREDVYTSDQVDLLATFASQAAIALENARLFDEARRRLEQLQALRDIDTAISGSFDARVTLSIFLDKVTTHLRVDAADILLLNPRSQTLEFLTSRGFRTTALQHTRLRLGAGYAGQAALERRTISVPDLREAKAGLDRSPHLADEGFVSYFATPLIAKGQTQGVLEVFNRRPMSPDAEWLDFLSTLAGQAAIAIDSTSLFDNLQRANVELTLAYDTTLEGWSKALDLRDKETEGHTLRVTDLALRLARAMGVPDETIVHVRRGALLHDIGKMGIPDGILLKPGPLTDDEWEVMRRHPVYAYQLLSPIAYLRPALAIPYAHHEKWDGSGYPRGLKGEEIPVEARIFAIVDVWDALTSDRPYRPAWPKERAREHIYAQAGTHFDPKVADVFLRMVGEMDQQG